MSDVCNSFRNSLAPKLRQYVAKWVPVDMLHAATGFAMLRKVEDCSIFSATSFAMALRCKLQIKLPRVTAHLKIAWVENACNVARRVSRAERL